MMRFVIECDFGGQKAPFRFYLGNEPADGCHPLKYQAHWLRTERGGEVPAKIWQEFAKLTQIPYRYSYSEPAAPGYRIPHEVWDQFVKLLSIALENSVSFEELCKYAMTSESATKPPAPQAPGQNTTADPEERAQ